jgi:hypothetical protein
MMVAACAATPPAPPIESTRNVSGTPAEVRSRIEAAASTLGLGAQADGTSLQLSSAAAPAAWADCPTQLVRSYDDVAVRADFAAPQSRAAAVLVGLVATGGGTSVSVTPRFTATYRNVYRNLPFEGPCSSTGALERALLDAAG